MDHDVNRIARELNEMIGDRGWNEQNELDEIKNAPQIKPLPIKEEQYRACVITLAKKALYYNDPNACEEYFELKRRALHGNHYSEIAGMEEIEIQMWEIYHRKKDVDNVQKR